MGCTQQLKALGQLPQVGLDGQNLGHLKIFLLIEISMFEQQLLLLADFVTSDLRVHDPG